MGRPLNKKYFGNRNIGTNGYETVTTSTVNSGTDGDDHIGGEGILAIIPATEHGDVLINSSYPAPTLVVPTPTIANGVKATVHVIWEVDRVALTSGGANYEHTGLPVNFTLTGLGGGVVGSMSAVGAGPGYPATTAGLNFTGPGSNRGEFIDTPPTANLTYEVCTPVNITGGGDNAQAQVFFRVKRIEVVQKGSGYAGTETFSWNTAGGSGTPFPGVPTFTKTVDTGAVGSATNQENAIIAYAYVDGLEEVDIAKQVSTNRYRINSNATGNEDKAFFIGRLKTTGVASTGIGTNGQTYETEMNIWAFDEDGGSYLVKKLTARKAVVVPFACARLSKTAGTRFPVNGDGTPKSVPWKFFEGQTNASSGYVKIENA